ncbi:next to BRCA1 gene 1 protein isoform X4 [Phycodurus eques]|uniref:next to BRCA1 gene 1 protein isoform X4 n=1 Tax=Phycodurus eques TaxID=693459 RepID=UPI002ACDC3B7|nr:next to BRCA1 gene 1 protein isoform X4 [Phycodurus eques]
MDFCINVKVNFRGNSKNFLLSGSETKSWDSMEAMVKRSFGLCSLQLTYFDEENEEVSINSQVEYEEALKEIMKEVKGTKEEDKTPPAWFTSYMEKFKDQVVREAVEKICREFSGQCCIHKPLSGVGASREDAISGPAVVPEVSSSTLPGAPSSSTLPCSSCRGQTTGGGYQCSVCTSCTLCEPCSFSHDPSHNLVRARTPLSIPEHGSPAPDHSRFYRRGDRSFRKAEKQRLKAEKRLLKAEVKEIRKQLRMERRGIQWSSSQRDGSSSPVLLQPRATQHNSPERPKRPCPLMVPTMTATFLDENLPDGTRLRPGTKFIKYWKMRNTGTMSWSSDTKLKFMWGNLAVGSGDRWREVSVPFLQPGQVGIVSVALCAPSVEGSYTSHWRLAHTGEQFGPRVWCSIVVDPLAPAPMMADGILVSPCVTPQGKNPVLKEGKACTSSRKQPPVSVDSGEEYYIPSVDLLTAQDLLSFELLDINIVQELESVPNNTPADMTPCISPLPQDGHQKEKSSPSLGLIQEETEIINSIMEDSGIPAQEEGEEDISGTQFVCETVIRSMTLEEAPDQTLVRGSCSGAVVRPSVQIGSCVKSEGVKTEDILDSSHNPLKPPAMLESSLPSPLKASLPAPLSIVPAEVAGPSSVPITLNMPLMPSTLQESTTISESEVPHIDCAGMQSKRRESEKEPKVKDGLKTKEGVRSRSSSTSSEEYIIILPDCFDTSRPLVESMYSSALSQPGDISDSTPADPETLTCEHPGSTSQEEGKAHDITAVLGTGTLGNSSANDMLCTSQTLDDEPLTPEVVAPPTAILTPSPGNTGEAAGDNVAAKEETDHSELNQTEDASGGEKKQSASKATADTEVDCSEDPSITGVLGFPCGCGSPGPPSGAKPGGGVRRRAPAGWGCTHRARPAQPERVTWVPLPNGSPPVGGAIGVGCSVSWAVAEGADLDDPILGYRNCLYGRGISPLWQGRSPTWCGRLRSSDYL